MSSEVALTERSHIWPDQICKCGAQIYHTVIHRQGIGSDWHHYFCAFPEPATDTEHLIPIEEARAMAAQHAHQYADEAAKWRKRAELAEAALEIALKRGERSTTGADFEHTDAGKV